ncbi:MAG TPA: allantoicase [Gemmatimonadales bacterium]|nr:allantoicase [Gemmatimonadales bacterium]
MDPLGFIDLASARVGGRALVASDEFFAPKENLLAPGRGVFIEGKYTDRGKWMDGWETRRRRGPEGEYDWCVIRLGIPGLIRAITVDTNHFRGNHPAACSLDAAMLTGALGSRQLRTLDRAFTELLPRSPLTGHTENEFTVRSGSPYTHVRLKIYPDGGVARLRVWGEARPDWERMARARRAVDLVAVEHGGLPLATSDQFFSEPLNLIMPGRSRDMADGWETRRRRGPGHDWVVLRLGRRGVIERVELDTTHFKGNFPESASLEGCDVAGGGGGAAPGDDARWRELVARTPLRANALHRMPVARPARTPVTHVRLNIFPDGGVARVRLWGRPDPLST